MPVTTLEPRAAERDRDAAVTLTRLMRVHLMQ